MTQIEEPKELTMYAQFPYDFTRRMRLYEISPTTLSALYIFGDLNSGQCKRYMLLCNSRSDAGNARGHFGKDLHVDGGEASGSRIELD